MMKKQVPAANPDAYVHALSGWQRALVEKLRASTLAAGKDLVEVIRWGHLVYFSNGPVLLIRAEEKRVLFGFLRGKRLREIDARLVASGKYELATMQLLQDGAVSDAVARHLVREAIRLNARLGDPTKAAAVRPKPSPTSKAKLKGKAKAKRRSSRAGGAQQKFRRAVPRSAR